MMPLAATLRDANRRARYVHYRATVCLRARWKRRGAEDLVRTMAGEGDGPPPVHGVLTP